jgi:hypothetical protein
MLKERRIEGIWIILADHTWRRAEEQVSIVEKPVVENLATSN